MKIDLIAVVALVLMYFVGGVLYAGASYTQINQTTVKITAPNGEWTVEYDDTVTEDEVCAIMEDWMKFHCNVGI